MAAKFDKEQLIKHHFWIVLGVVLLCWMIALCILLFTVMGPITARRKAYEDALAKINQNKTGLKNDSFLPPWKAHQDLFRRHKDTIWAQAWELQKGLYVWPTDPEARLDVEMPDTQRPPLAKNEREIYQERLYDKQFDAYKTELERAYPELAEHQFVERVGPVELAGGGNGLFERRAKDKWNEKNPVTREEMWLLEEDFWVKKDMLDLVRNVLNETAQMKAQYVLSPESITLITEALGEAKAPEETVKSVLKELESLSSKECSSRDEFLLHVGSKLERPIWEQVQDRVREQVRMKDQGPTKDSPKDMMARYRFRNEPWELNLIIEKLDREWQVSALSTIKNIHPGKRTLKLSTPDSPLGLVFHLKQAGFKPLPLVITNEPLPPGHEAKLKKPLPLFPIEPGKPFEVEQVWDWYTAPIKRVDALQVGTLKAQSARTVPEALRPNPNLPNDLAEEGAPAAAPGAAPAAPAGGGRPPAAQAAAMGMAPPGPGAGRGGTSAADSRTPFNGIDRHRYIQVTQQCRHLPLAMVLIVDQSCVPDVVAAFSNSRLRIQVTQVEISHVRGIKPPVAGQPTKGDSLDKPGPLASASPTPGTPAVSALRPGMRRQAGGEGRGGMGDGGDAGPTPVKTTTQPAPGPGGNAGKTAVPTDDDPNLVEVGIYGIAALYERFDEAKAAAAAGAAGDTTPPKADKLDKPAEPVTKPTDKAPSSAPKKPEAPAEAPPKSEKTPAAPPSTSKKGSSKDAPPPGGK
jgi:hypothetical protein